MSASKTNAQGSTSSAQLISNITQWNAENDQKNSDLAATKAKATEEFLNQSVAALETKSLKYTKEQPKTISEADRKALAVKEKDKGNEYFSKGQYASAIDHYTEAIKHDPTNTACFANRALCLIKTERWIKAIEDCNTVIKLDPNYVKAYLRRGLAYKNSKKLSLALIDFEKVLSLEPTNKEAASELKGVKELLAKEEQIHLKTNKQEQRNVTGAAVTGVKAPVVKPESNVFLQQVKAEKIPASSSPVSAATASPKEEPKQLPLKPVEVSNSLPHVTPVTSAPAPAPTVNKNSTLSALIPNSVPEVAPKHFYEFERCWNSLTSDRDALYKYLKLIKPESYAALFKESMTSELLLVIWQLLLDYSCPDEVEFALQVMKCLPKLSRFDMLLLFLEKSEKQLLEELWGKFARSNVDAKALTTIKALYR